MTDEKENREQFTALKNDKQDDSTLECAVCLQNCVHPIKLACEHIFCFLCAKGVANKNQPCPLCRQDISFSLIDKPRLVSIDEDTSNDEKIDIAPNDCSWFYEGRNGWWEYEERLVGEIEEAFQRSKNELNLDDGTSTKLHLVSSDPSSQSKCSSHLFSISIQLPDLQVNSSGNLQVDMLSS